MAWFQTTFTLPKFSRGFHLITSLIEKEIKPELTKFQVGIVHVFIHHTSASLSINENADPTVRTDMESHFNKMVPENAPYYLHTYEGPDDMPAHIKASLLGHNVSFPLQNGRFLLGTWQGIYLCEHRDHASGRRLTITIHGEKFTE